MSNPPTTPSHIYVPAGWKDDGTTLLAPNGYKVILGFREYVLRDASWDAQNWPLENEHTFSQPANNASSEEGGTQQLFRQTILEWTAKAGVYTAWIGEALLALRNQPASPLSADLVAQLTTISQQLQPLCSAYNAIQSLLKGK